jgi:DNA modification methylase
MIDHLEGDCRDILPTLTPGSVHTIVTSPPYWAQRSYLPDHHPDKAREIGQERTAHQYIDTLVGIFRQLARVLVSNGTAFLNLGDKYADKTTASAAGVKDGDLLGLPWRVALALQADGWFLRSDIIWFKPNPKPESVKDRCTKSHEYLFMLSKQKHYHYDADALREPVTSTGGASFGKQRHSTEGTGAQSRRLKSAAQRNHPLGKNKRDVWKIPVRAYPGAHFAVMPKDLVKPCILAGCPKGGTVLDPFAGSGTTGEVATELGRNAILIELNPVYVEMQKGRQAVQKVLGANPQEKKDDREEQPGWLF